MPLFFATPPVIGPGNLPSNIAQGAAALCVAIKTKNKNFRQLAVSGGVTALLGVTEPALFGVNVRLRKPLIATTIGGGLGGLYAGFDRCAPFWRRWCRSGSHRACMSVKIP